jgi:hypothetical protein
MSYLRIVPTEQADGLLRELYAQDLSRHGFVPKYTRAWSLRPAVLAAWKNLLESIRSSMSARRYELVTIVAAARLRCLY